MIFDLCGIPPTQFATQQGPVPIYFRSRKAILTGPYNSIATDVFASRQYAGVTE